MQQHYVSQGTTETLFWVHAICTLYLYLYLHSNISMGFRVFLMACCGAKGRHCGWLRCQPGPEEQRQLCRCSKTRWFGGFLHHKQKQGVQWLFLSTANPFSQEISRLFFNTQVSDSSNNLLISNKEEFSRRDYNQAGFALPKLPRASATDFQDIPAKLNIHF